MCRYLECWHSMWLRIIADHWLRNILENRNFSARGGTWSKDRQNSMWSKLSTCNWVNTYRVISPWFYGLWDLIFPKNSKKKSKQIQIRPIWIKIPRQKLTKQNKIDKPNLTNFGADWPKLTNQMNMNYQNRPRST